MKLVGENEARMKLTERAMVAEAESEILRHGIDNQ